MEIFTKMASKTALYVVLVLAILSVTAANYVEALAAEAFDPSASGVVLRVALRDGFYSKYADILSGQWVTDTSAEFTNNKTEILNYCRKKYPNSDVTNIVDSSQPAVIKQWCPVSGDECTSSAQVTYYRCLVGPFESDALMVYNVCKFYHKHDENMCREPGYWKGVANADCRKKKMAANSTGMLLPCKTDHFKGVEYTCCPAPASRQVVPEQQQPPEPERDDVVVKPEITSNILDDPYFAKMGLQGNAEKSEYAEAKSRLSARQKMKMARVMQQWQEAQDHYLQLKSKDAEKAEKMRKEMTQRFEQTIGSMEAENAEETGELKEAHQVHVEVSLGEKINSSYEAFLVTVEVGKPKTKKILHALKRYLHAIQKARQHYIKHYKHLRKTDPLQADQHKRFTIRMLNSLDLQVARSVDKLQMLPDLYAELKPKVDALLQSTADNPEDAALVRTTEEEELAEPTEAPEAKRADSETIDQILDSPLEEVQEEGETEEEEMEEVHAEGEEEEKEEEEEEEEELMEIEEQEEPVDLEGVENEEMEEETEEDAAEAIEVEEELIVEEEDTQAPALAKTLDTKPSNHQTKTSTHQTKTSSPAKPSTPVRPATSIRPKTSTPNQTELETPTPSKDLMAGTETEIEVPAKVPVIAVKPIDSYLDEELDPPIETEVEKPKTLIVAQKPAAKVQKSAVRMEKQRLVNRKDETIDTSVTKKQLQLRSEPMMAFGLACGVLAVATVLVIAVLIVRRKTRRTPVNSGFTEIDPNLTVEQRHIVSMQQNGYENPTYKYFDMQ